MADERIERFRILNQYVKKGQIVFAGSSLMEQFPIYEFMQDFDIQKTIYNRGIGGITTTDMLSFLETCIFELEPSKVFLNIGTNDLNDCNYKEAQLIERYEKIVTAIKERLPKVNLYLMAFYPINDNLEKNNWTKELFKTRSNANLFSANKAIEQLALKHNIRYIDVNKNLYDDNKQLKEEYTLEGVHMFANGYKAVLDEMLTYIME